MVAVNIEATKWKLGGYDQEMSSNLKCKRKLAITINKKFD
jgi:hypothetical protein